MEICGHIILKNEVVGIGPLMTHQSTDQATRMVYNSKQLWFYLHLRNHSVKIESNWFDVGNAQNTSEMERKAREDYKNFYNEYDAVRKVVDDLVGEYIVK